MEANTARINLTAGKTHPIQPRPFPKEKLIPTPHPEISGRKKKLQETSQRASNFCALVICITLLCFFPSDKNNHSHGSEISGGTDGRVGGFDSSW